MTAAATSLPQATLDVIASSSSEERKFRMIHAVNFLTKMHSNANYSTLQVRVTIDEFTAALDQAPDSDVSRFLLTVTDLITCSPRDRAYWEFRKLEKPDEVRHIAMLRWGRWNAGRSNGISVVHIQRAALIKTINALPDQETEPFEMMFATVLLRDTERQLAHPNFMSEQYIRTLTFNDNELSADAKVLLGSVFGPMPIGGILCFSMDPSRPTPRAKAALEQLVSTNWLAYSSEDNGGQTYRLLRHARYWRDWLSSKSDGYEHPDRWMYDQIEPVKAKATAPKPSIAIKSPPKRQSR